MPRWARRLRGPLLIAAVVVLVDQVTKHWALNALVDRDIEVVGSLRFNLAFNTGMAFSSGEGLGPWIAVLAVAVVAFLLRTVARDGATVLQAVAIGLLAGGAIGNLSDRLFRGDRWLRGAVVDFIDVQWWPIFNVADCGIVIGAVLLVIAVLFTAEERAT